jgi:hypothetical protein
MPPLERIFEHRVSERSILRPGTRFRATGGPLYKLADGTEVPLGARGPFVFRALLKRGSCQLIEAADREGNTAILHIGGRRKRATPEIVTRPYRIKSVIRKNTKPRRK